MTDRIAKYPKEWKEQLTPEQYEICINHGTEPPFSGKYNDSKLEGSFKCVCCGENLFSSNSKFDSGSGWPSFWAPKEEAVKTETDSSIGMQRVEVLCKKCDAHLGHVFEDGPQPTGLRYCINSVSLKLQKD
jgi:peptide-methionine (R)-S-oxide reductase